METTVKEAIVDIKVWSLLPRAAEAAVKEGMSVQAACRHLALMMQALIANKEDSDAN